MNALMSLICLEYIRSYTVMQQFLEDKKNGKEVDWKGYKLKALELSEIYTSLGLDSKSLRLHQCGNQLSFKVFEDCEKKLKHAIFCKVRLCPMCSWRRSLKIFGQVSQVMNYVTDNYNYRYIFLTLTVRNVTGDVLSDAIDSLFKSFNLLTKRKEFKAISKGWFRCLEVSHNWGTDEYHPHFHMIIAVNKSYFTNPKLYLNQCEWTRLWKSCGGFDYTPMVDVRIVKPDKNGSFGKAVAEVAKYTAKPNDYILSDNDKQLYKQQYMDDDGTIKMWTSYAKKRSTKVVKCLDIALHHRRLATFGGLFKEIHKLLNLDNAEDGDLINTDNDEELREDLNYIVVTYNWHMGYKNYVEWKEKKIF